MADFAAYKSDVGALMQDAEGLDPDTLPGRLPGQPDDSVLRHLCVAALDMEVEFR